MNFTIAKLAVVLFLITTIILGLFDNLIIAARTYFYWAIIGALLNSDNLSVRTKRILVLPVYVWSVILIRMYFMYTKIKNERDKKNKILKEGGLVKSFKDLSNS